MMPMNDNWFHSPLPINIVYWTFLGLMAVFVHPAVLALLLFLPGFGSSPQVTVEDNGSVVTVRGSGDWTEQELRAAVKEAMN